MFSLSSLFKKKTKAKKSVFISYNSADTTFAYQIADDLKRAEIDVWLAPKELTIGDSLTTEITNTIKKSDFLVVIVSENSVNSDWVKKEMKIMENSKGSKFIIPLKLGNCELPSIFSKDVLHPDFSDEKKYVFMLRLLLNGIDPSLNKKPNFVSGKELQDLINKLPVPKKRSMTDNKSAVENIKYFSLNSIDLGELESLMHWERSKFYSALRELISTNKVEVLLVKSISDGSHAAIPAGKTMILPMIFKGLLPPDLRSSKEEVEAIISQMEKI